MRSRATIAILLVVLSVLPHTLSSVPVNRQTLVIWILGREAKGVIEAYDVTLYYSSPPPFIIGSVLADAILIVEEPTEIYTWIIEEAQKQNIPIFTNSSLLSKKYSNVTYFEGNIEKLIDLLHSKKGLGTNEGYVSLNVEVEGYRVKDPYILSITGLDTGYYSTILLEEGKTVFSMRRGVYILSLTRFFAKEIYPGYKGFICIRKPTKISIRKIYPYTIYAILSANTSFASSTYMPEKWEWNGVFIYKLEYIGLDNVSTLNLRVNNSKLNLRISCCTPLVYEFITPGKNNMQRITITNLHTINQSVQGVALLRSKGKIWATSIKGSEIYVPSMEGYLEVFLLDNLSGNIVAIYRGPTNTEIFLSPLGYLVADITDADFVYLVSKNGWFEGSYRSYSSIKGRRYLVIKGSERESVAKVYIAGSLFSVPLPRLKYGKTIFIPDLAKKAVKELSFKVFREAKNAVRDMEQAVSAARLYRLDLPQIEAARRRAEILLAEAEKEFLEGNYLVSKYDSEAALQAALEAISSMKDAYIAAIYSGILTLFIILVSSLVISAILTETYARRVLFSLIIFYILLVLAYYIHPGFKLIFNIQESEVLRKILLVNVVALLFYYFMFKEINQIGGENYDPENASWISVLALTFHIATKSLRKRKIRTLLTFLTITVSIFSFVAFTSVGYSLGVVSKPIPHTSIIGATIKLEGGIGREELVIIKNLAKDAKEIYRSIKAVEYSVHVGEKDYIIEGVIAIDPDLEDKTLGISSILLEGNLPLPGEVVISEPLARGMGLGIGSILEIKTKEGDYTIATMKVSGIFDPYALESLYDVDGERLLPIKLQQTELGSVRVKVSAEKTIIVNIKDSWRMGAYPRINSIYIGDYDKADSIAKFLADRLGAIVAVAAGGKGRLYLRGYKIGVEGGEAIVILAISTFVAVNTMLASLYEKKKELSIYSSLGMNPLHVKLLFIAEAIILGIAGGGIGYFSGISLSILGSNIPGLQGLRTHFTPEWTILPMISAIGIMTLATLKPAETASLQVVPSFERRWRLRFKHGGYIREVLPFRINIELINEYLTFIKKRIESTYPPHSVLLRTKSEIEVKNDIVILKIQADLVSEGRASAEIILRHRLVSKRFYSVELVVKPLSITGEKYFELVYNVVDEIRKSLLAWQAIYRSRFLRL